MRLALVRHADAGSRAAWTGPDHARPLVAHGDEQAEAIAHFLAGVFTPGAVTVASSPAVRCRSTVTPAAGALGVTVDDDPRLFEGTREIQHADLLTELLALEADTVICSHGDVIPSLLTLAIDDGLRPAAPLAWHKASVWLLDHDGHGWTTGTYHRPAHRR